MAVDNTDNSIYSFKGEKVFGNHMKKTVYCCMRNRCISEPAVGRLRYR